MFKVGTRLCLNDELCTIRFVGTLEVWPHDVAYGIEWDNKSKKRHSGEYNKSKYFSTKLPNTGSFIKEAKLVSWLQKAQSIYQALSARYGEEIYNVSKIYFGSKKVESFGFDKLTEYNKKFHNLKVVSLRKNCVSDEFTREEYEIIKSQCFQLTDLDLSFNLVNNLPVLIQQLKAFSFLKTLDISGNRFSYCDGPKNPSLYLEIDRLNASSCAVDVQQLLSILELFPVLKFVSLDDNVLKDLDKFDPKFSSTLESLSLQNNGIKQVPPCLEQLKLIYLNISSNKIECVNDIKLHTVQYLDISNNLIKDWSEIDKLNIFFPNLKSLRIDKNPILKTREFKLSSFYHVIARFNNLETLNGSTIDNDLRTEAEQHYISQIVSFKITYDQTSERFKYLSKKYKFNHSATPICSPWLGRQVIDIKVIEPSTKEVFAVRVSVSITVRHLKLLVCRHFDKNVVNTELCHADSNNLINHFDKEFVPISDYHIQSNSKLVLKTTDDN